MAKKDEETVSLELQGGSNLTKLKKDAGKLYKDIKNLKIKRAEINDQISAHRENLKSMGISRSAQAEVERRDALDAEKRREHDFGVQVYGEAVGTPVDLFSAFDERQDEKPASKPKKTSAKKGDSVPLAGLDKSIERAEATRHLDS